MENALENKAKFFAQYWGQEVLSDNICFNKLTVDIYKMSISRLEPSSLKLKPLSSITDEDAIEVAKIKFPTESHKHFPDHGKHIIRNKNNRNVMEKMSIIDFLRSKSYALPYMGLSVEEMVEYGWIKLKEES
ncbi:hypothetical protein [Sphingobacterium mizutaii]|uniref:hypothetical protein n=1 Tax=Sphingobacterium mizutaii TaxID=1010 RepID=UPI00289A1AC1|nr:hypothetical protein [Sphingobacterium mizutaii]